MASKPVKPTTPLRRGLRYAISLKSAAKVLGCSAFHLGEVLAKRRPSYGLAEGYDMLVKTCGATATSARGPRRKANG